MPSLRFKLPNSSEVIHVLTQDLVSIGRRADNTIQILDRSVSGHHAEFLLIDGHYRLHDLKSTNLSFVEGQAVVDFHLNSSCRLTFGNVECEFDATPNPEDLNRLTPAQLERDVAFLRGENSELAGQLEVLQRRIDILSSARLVTGKTDNAPLATSSDALRAITGERDDLRHQSAGLKLELDRMREELSLTARERDQARRTLEQLRGEQASGADQNHKASTQRIELPVAELNFPTDAEPLTATQKLFTETSAVSESHTLSATR